jgi:hypothetical protein
MPTTHRTLAPAVAAVEVLPHALTFVVAPAASVLCAALAVRAIRRRRLHWSWMALAAVPAVALAPALGADARLAALAAALAANRARRRHRADLEAGADLGRLARDQVTPLAAARLLTARITEHTALGERAAVLGPRRHEAGTLMLGRTAGGRPVRIPFSPTHAAHALIVGATGSGKTVTQTLLAERAIAEGRAVVVVDPKGDGDMRTRLARSAAHSGRRFLEWTPTGPCSYNPYARGGETEIADRLLAGEHFTEPHYLRQAQRYLGHAIRALRSCGREVHLEAIVEALDPSALERLLREAEPDLAARGHAYMDALTGRQERDLAGVRDRLAILAESEVGRWLSAGASFDLLDACREGAVVLFRLEADSRPLAAQMIGAAIVADLQSTVATLQGAPAPTLVVIDEFSALGARQVTALFGRARSAGVSLLLGTQELADLRLPGAERLLEQVLGNVSLLIAHRQVVPESADLVSRLAGSRGCWRVSWSSGRRTTRTRGDEPALDPELLMGLTPGLAVTIGFGATRETSLVQVRPAGGER